MSHRNSHARRLATALVALSAGTGLMLALPGGAAAAAPSPAATAPSSSCRSLVPFVREAFPHPLAIDNRFLPMTPGTQLTLQGTENTGGAPTAHQVVFTVTDLSKVVDGVRTRVIYDVDSDSGQVAEAELALFAQDVLGDVWNLGEYPEVYRNGRFTGAPDTWVGGLDGAQPGIHMLAVPVVGIPEYLQGRAPAIDFLDCARVVKRDGRACVPVRCFDNVLTTRERSPLDPSSGAQTKEHAPGVGIVRIGAVNDPQGETLVLVKAAHLGPVELAQVRQQALVLDRRGHRASAVWARTADATGPS